jgi:predicted Zn-dependent protease
VLLATALVVAAWALWIRARSSAPSPPAPTPVSCGGESTEPCASTPDSASAAPTGPVRQARDVCQDAGYLCAGLDTGTAIVIRHWVDFHGTMVVHVPPPSFEDATTARRLQDAAAEGILQWNRLPFPLMVDRRGSRRAQIEVRWSRVLGASHLGVAHTMWSPAKGLMVQSIELATRSPFDASRILDPAQVALTAAHEMGHALGLPHSDQPRDVMYPTNTSKSLTARDFRTVEVLYKLADGTRIVR